jgi:tetratricopeptide (TPR) repeat protein
MDWLSPAASVAGVAALVVGGWQLRVAILTRRDGVREPVGPDRSGLVGALPVAAPYGRLPVEILGREALEAELKDLVLRRRRRRQPTGVLVLAGMGGVGKSTLALWLAGEFRSRGRQVWWINAADTVSLRGGILEILRRLEAESLWQAVSDGAPTAADQFWEFLNGRRPGALLVLDNADAPEHLSADGASPPADATGWARTGRGVVTLVTTRSVGAQIWGTTARIIVLDVLGERAAAAVLRSLAPQLDDPDGGALALARRLGALPLALHLAGAYLASPFARWRSFSDYLRALDGDQAGQAVAELDAGQTDPRATVSRTWDLSLDSLADKGLAQGRDTLYLLACFAPTQPVPASWLPDDLTHNLRGLAEVALVDAVPSRDGPPDLTLHPVIADTCRAQLTADSPIPGSAVRLLDATISGLDAERPADWPDWERLIPHVRALLEWSVPLLDGSDLTRLLRLGRNTLSSLWLDGNRESAGGEALARLILSAAARLGDRHPDLLAARHLLGVTLHVRGRQQEAEAILRPVLDDRRVVLGDTDPDTLRTRDDLAGTILMQGRYAEAEQMYRELIADQEAALGPEHPDTLTTYIDLAWSIGIQGRADEAADLCRQTVDTDRRLLGDEHPRTLDAQTDLAQWTSEQGALQEAADLCSQLIGTQQRVLSARHPLTLSTRAILARTTAAQNRPAEAESLLRPLINDMEQVFSPTDFRMLTTRRDLAGVLTVLGRTTEADTIYQNVLRLQQQTFGPTHPETLKTSAARESGISRTRSSETRS